MPNPIECIWAACNHYVPGLSLSIREALYLYTRNAARGNFDEKERDSLETWELADMIILNRNPISLEPADLRSLNVERLLLRGKPYIAGQRRGDLLSRAFMNGSKQA